MTSWMSAKIIFCLAIVVICTGCVPPAYRHSQDTNRNNNKQKSYQIQNNDEDTIQIPQYDENYYMQSDSYYSTYPVYYTVPDNTITTDSQKVESEENYKSDTPLIKKGRWHIIKKGETIYRLSKQYNVPVDIICSANNIKNVSTIKAGQKIYIPPVTAKSDISTENYCTSPIPVKKTADILPFIWPVPSVKTYTRDQGGVRPIGIIITSKPKSKVVASAGGKVVKIGNMRGFGNFIVIVHQKDFYTIYSKLEAITVREGQAVLKGSTIGFLSDSNPSLHFQINHSGKPLDPLHYLAQK
ncbi:MAG: peptidoglycan DD-metalloendopeptidase family protein [Spirochaetes bacterium]|nr:peptidoglycan DD-metalloendopeptidase family protein [Spirochaetota bacterium]